MASFPHRTNPDDTIDSICPLCYATVGHVYHEAELERLEADHICDPARLAYFDEGRRRSEKQPPLSVEFQRVERIRRVG